MGATASCRGASLIASARVFAAPGAAAAGGWRSTGRGRGRGRVLLAGGARGDGRRVRWKVWPHRRRPGARSPPHTVGLKGKTARVQNMGLSVAFLTLSTYVLVLMFILMPFSPWGLFRGPCVLFPVGITEGGGRAGRTPSCDARGPGVGLTGPRVSRCPSVGAAVRVPPVFLTH